MTSRVALSLLIFLTCSPLIASVLEINQIVYEGLKLPVPGKGSLLSASYNELTGKIDGNTGTRPNGTIEPEELYQEILGNRAKYGELIAKMVKAGFLDPFELTEGLQAHVKGLLEKYKPKNQVETAVILIRSIVPETLSFYFAGKKYSGLSREDGGLEVKKADTEFWAYQGSMKPQQLLDTPVEKRRGCALDQSHLLVVFLRIANIESGIRMSRTERRAYAIARLDGQKYRLDVSRRIFLLTEESADPDRISIYWHYINISIWAPELKAQAAFLKSNTASFWSSLGFDLSLENPGEATAIFERALSVASGKKDKCNVLDHMASAFVKAQKFEEAISCFEKIRQLKLKQGTGTADHNIGKLLYKLGRYTEALEFYDKLTLALPVPDRSISETDLYRISDSWYEKGIVYKALKDDARSEECIGKATGYLSSYHSTHSCETHNCNYEYGYNAEDRLFSAMDSRNLCQR